MKTTEIEKVKDTLYREYGWSGKEINDLGVKIENVIEATEQELNRTITKNKSGKDRELLKNELKTVDEWLNSKDVWVTDKNGNIIEEGRVECKSGSLLNRLLK